MSLNILKVYLLFLSFLFFTLPSEAKDFDEELTLWPTVSVQAPLYKDKLSVYGYWQPTITQNIKELTPWVFRGALIYTPRKNLNLWLGYDQHYSFDSVDQLIEQRAWQQITYDQKIKKLQVNHRIRLEDRFLKREKQPAFRLRLRNRATYPIGKNKKWYIASNNELLLNLTSSSPNRRAGFSEDRIFIGLGRKLNKYVNLEGGYQASFVNFGINSNLIRHSFVTNLSINLPYEPKILKK